MKQMTCKQIGGVCDAVFSGENSGEIVKAASDHILEKAKTDPAHEKASKEMEAIYNDKKRHAEWEKEFKAKWDAAPTV